MHIGLIDVDSHNFPNLALMKLSACSSGGAITAGFSERNRIFINLTRCGDKEVV